jgi:hypothetical protein
MNAQGDDVCRTKGRCALGLCRCIGQCHALYNVQAVATPQRCMLLLMLLTLMQCGSDCFRMLSSLFRTLSCKRCHSPAHASCPQQPLPPREHSLATQRLHLHNQHTSAHPSSTHRTAQKPAAATACSMFTNGCSASQDSVTKTLDFCWPLTEPRTCERKLATSMCTSFALRRLTCTLRVCSSSGACWSPPCTPTTSCVRLRKPRRPLPAPPAPPTALLPGAAASPARMRVASALSGASRGWSAASSSRTIRSP